MDCLLSSIKRAEVGSLGARAPASLGRLTVVVPVCQEPSPSTALEDQAREHEEVWGDARVGRNLI